MSAPRPGCMPSQPNRFEDELGHRVRALVLEVIGAGGYDGVTVKDLALRLGAAPADLYARWSSKPDLLVGIAYSFLNEIPVPNTGDVRGDLLDFATSWTQTVYGDMRPLQYAVVSRIGNAPDIADAYSIINRYLRETLESIIRRGIEVGQLPSNARVDLAIEVLRARWTFRFILGMPIDAEIIRETIEQVILPMLHHSC